MKKIFLTIDDGPSPYFNELLNYLIKNNHKAIFFCRGSNLEDLTNQKLVVKAIKKGFIIGNHSYSHPNFNRISFREAKDQIIKTDGLIKKLYTKAGVTQPLKIFRFPYFKSGMLNFWRLQKLLRNMGYKNPYYYDYPFLFRLIKGKYDLYCTLDPKDYSNKTTQNIILSRIKNAKPNDIIDLHDQQYSVKYLIKPICEYLSSNGFVLTIQKS